jgi:hypothetical protein
MTPERHPQHASSSPVDEEEPTPDAELVIALVPGFFCRSEPSRDRKRGWFMRRLGR